MANPSGRIPDELFEAMTIEVANSGADDDAKSRFESALDAYRLAANDADERECRRELAAAYVACVKESALDPSRVLSTIHWRAIERCSRGEPYLEEERKESPFEVVAISTKRLRVYATDGSNSWKIFRIHVARDGSFHRFSLIEKALFSSDFHYSFHPTGVVHDVNPNGRIRSASLYWNNFRELDISPMGGIGVSPASFQDPRLQSLREPGVHSAGLTLEIPPGDTMLRIEMWLGQAEQLRDPRSLHERLVPAASDRIVKIEFFPMASFRDPKDDHTFSIDIAIAQIVRADD